MVGAGHRSEIFFQTFHLIPGKQQQNRQDSAKNRFYLLFVGEWLAQRLFVIVNIIKTPIYPQFNHKKVG